MLGKYGLLLDKIELALENSDYQLATTLDTEFAAIIKADLALYIPEHNEKIRLIVEKYTKILKKVEQGKKQVNVNIAQFAKNKQNLKKYKNV